MCPLLDQFGHKHLLLIYNNTKRHSLRVVLKNRLHKIIKSNRSDGIDRCCQHHGFHL